MKAGEKRKESTSSKTSPGGERPKQEKNEGMDSVIVLPGDDIGPHMVSAVISADDKIVLGTGLRAVKDTEVRATMSGYLQYQCRMISNSTSTTNQQQQPLMKKKKKHVYWIRSSNAGRYHIQLQDRVVAIVQERVGPDGAGGELYRLHLGQNSKHTAILSNLSFEGATKRNKPNLVTGQVLYARVAEYVPCLEPVLSCQLGPNDESSSGIKSKDWMTNEGVYGILQGGTCMEVSIGLARVLLSPNASSALWDSVTRHTLTSCFEIAIGVNGLVWIHSNPSPQATIVLQNAILNSQLLTPEQTAAMVQQLAYTMQKQMKQQQDAVASPE